MKTKLFILFVFLLSFNSYAQIGFETHVLVDNSLGTSDPIKVFLSDIDGDGDLDLLSASYSDDKIAWYENLDGQGHFGIQQIITKDADFACDVFACDIDGDGDNDVLSASTKDKKIAWYENLNRRGHFGEQQVIFLNRDAKIVYPIDVDGDGDNDVISVGAGENNMLAWHKNDGTGNFTEDIIISYPDYDIITLSVGDFDGDNDNDIMFSNTYVIGWFENDGLGNFSSSFNSVDNFRNAKIYTEDIDNDGDNDIVAMDNNDMFLYKNDGFGNFSTPNLILSGDLRIGSVKVIDIDGDNNNDIFFCGYNNTSWCKNEDGQGNFGNQQIILDGVSGDFVIDDINGDGLKDFVICQDWEDKIRWYENIDGLGNFGNENVIVKSEANGVSSVSSVDINGDGYNDIIIDAWGNLSWLTNIDGLGTYGNINEIANGSYYSAFFSYSDIDSDGDIDLVTRSSDRTKVLWYENIDGQGNFEEHILSNSDIESAYTKDIDSDGDQDVIFVSDNNVGWYENVNGLGDFSVEHVISNYDNTSANVKVDDLDGDGNFDVAISSNNGTDNGRLVWYKNDGLGEFGSEQIIYSSGNRPYPDEMCIGDIDGDGDNDIIFNSGNNSYLSWFENIDSFGDFSTEHIIILFDNFGSVHDFYLKDIDGDGDNDIVGVKLEKAFWVENVDGSGTFGSMQLFDGIIDRVFVDDVDGDGDNDVITTTYNLDRIDWRENILNKNEIIGTVKFGFDLDDCNSSNVTISKMIINNSNGTDSTSLLTNNNGIFQFILDAGSYNTKISSIVPNYFDVIPNNYSTTFAGVGNIDTTNFCIIPNQSINDLNIVVFPLEQPMVGAKETYQIIYNNSGTTQLDGSVILEFNEAQLSFLTASEIISSQTSNSITFDFSNLNPFETRMITVSFNIGIPPLVENGDLLVFSAKINPIIGDYTENDNIFKYYHTITGSYDPNDITVLEGEQILLEDKDEYLHYIIRFQNTGTARASFVKVTNILDDKLNLATFQLEDESHESHVEIKNGNEVNFIFESIYLPDSTTNEPLSHGYIAYKIKPKNDVVLGDIISNNAQIYFDFNQPVFTNTVNTEIVNPDTENPVAVCQNTDLYLNNDGEAILYSKFVDNGSSDNIRIVKYTLDNTYFDCSNLGNNDVTLTVEDEAGNIDFCTSNINVIDTISPVLNNSNLPNLISECEILSLTAPTATDNCSGLITGIHNLTMPITTQGTTIVTWTYDDGNGNTLSQIQNITIDDVTPPTVVTQDITVNLNGAPSVSILPSQIDAGSFDNCELSNLYLDINSFNTTGNFPVILSAEDINNNLSNGTAIVKVVDSTTGIKDEIFSNEFIIYPNPVNNLLIIKAGKEIVKVVELYNVLNEKVKIATTNTINTSKLPKGYYYINIETNSGKKVSKSFIKN